MKFIPKWGSPKAYLMSQTVSRKVRGRTRKKENIPVRNLAQEIASVASLSPSNIKENAKKRVSFDPASPSESNLESNVTKSPSAEGSVLSESRYNLRSISQNDMSNREKSKRQSMINKGFLTPSRARTNVTNTVNKSIYRTPKIQSTINNKPLKVDKKVSKEQKGIWREEITDLLNKTWKTSYLSTSVDFNYETNNLKKSYEAVLRNRILDTYPAYEVTVQIATTSMLYQNPKENDGVLFIVTTVEPERDDDTEPREPLLYRAFLIKSSKIQSEQLPNSEWFPLLLYRGAESIHQTFITWLQSSFGCYVTPKHLPQSCMLWLAALWSRVKCEQKYHGTTNIGSTIHFHYLIRPPCTEKLFKHSEEKRHIYLKVECQSSDIRNVWKRLTDSDKGTANSEEIIEFHNLMESYMESICLLPKSLLQLYLLKTPCMTISGDGRLRLTCSGKFPSVLRHLMEIFHETCHFKNVDFISVLPEEIISDIEDEMGI